MSVSQCTNFLLKGGKEELKITWDVSNGVIEIHRVEVCPPMDKKQSSRKKNVAASPDRHSIFIRYADMERAEAAEFCLSLQKAFAVIFNLSMEQETEGEEEVEYNVTIDKSLLEDDDDDDDEEDE